MSEADVKIQRCHSVNKVAVNTVTPYATRVPRWWTSLRVNDFLDSLANFQRNSDILGSNA